MTLGHASRLSSRPVPHSVTTRCAVPVGDVITTITLVLIAASTLSACTVLGGGLYEVLVVDPFWPIDLAYPAPKRRYLPAPVLDSRAHGLRGALDPSRSSRHGTTQCVRVALLVALRKPHRDASVVAGPGFVPSRRWRLRSPIARRKSTRRQRCRGRVGAGCGCRWTLSPAWDARCAGRRITGRHGHSPCSAQADPPVPLPAARPTARRRELHAANAIRWRWSPTTAA